jgi:UDP-glucose 4-epimerase
LVDGSGGRDRNDAAGDPPMKVLITGGSGFIGRNIVESLAGRHDVLAPTHDQLDLMDDVAVRETLRSFRPDAVVNCATRPGHRNAADPTGLVEANTRMFFNLARDPGLCPRLVHLGTGAVYDQRFYEPLMPEEYFDRHVPVDETGYSKYIIAKYAEASDHVIELRPFGVFGPWEDYAIRFISNAICKTLFDMPVTLRQDRCFSYVWIGDLVATVEHFAMCERTYAAYNVTPDAAVSLLDIANMVVEVSAGNVPVVVGAPGMGVEYSGDNSRLRAEMPALRLTSVHEAVERLYSWYAARVSELDPTLLLVDK